jgi:hypothetical protein
MVLVLRECGDHFERMGSFCYRYFDVPRNSEIQTVFSICWMRVTALLSKGQDTSCL